MTPGLMSFAACFPAGQAAGGPDADPGSLGLGGGYD